MGTESSKSDNSKYNPSLLYGAKFGMRAEDLSCFTAADLKKICRYLGHSVTRRAEMCPIVVKNLREDAIKCLPSASIMQIAKKMKIPTEGGKDEVVKQIYAKLDNSAPVSQKEVEPVLADKRIPKPTWRWDGERVHPISDLKWSPDVDNNKFDISVGKYIDSLTGQGNVSSVVGDVLDLPSINPVFAEVLDTMIKETGIIFKMWKITYHPTSPALQFEAVQRTRTQHLPKSNHYNCQLKDGYEYCMCCEWKVKNAQLQSLYEPKDSDWWSQTHSARMGKNVIDNGVVRIVKRGTGRLQSYIVILENDTLTAQLGRVKTMEEAAVIMAEAERKLHNGTGITVEEWQLKKLSVGDIEKIRKDSLYALGQTFKIRLNPKPQYQIWSMKQLLRLFQNPQVYPLVEAFKVVIPYSRIVSGAKLGSIIIYPENGRRVASVLLGLIKKLFSPYNVDEIGLGIVPRNNVTINPLIYYSGGNGDDKAVLKEHGVLGKFVDTNNNNAFYRGFEL